MKLLSNAFVLFRRCSFALLLFGCGEQSGNAPPEVAQVPQVKKVDPLEFLREVSPAESRGKLLFQKAFGGDKESSFRASFLYLQGNYGKAPKADQALAYINAAAEGGAWDAMFFLYRVYDLPRLKNAEKRESWKKKFVDATTIAANNGNSNAMVKLGFEFGEGDIVPKDEKLSCDWFLKAAVAGDKNGERYAGQCALKRKEGLDEAIKLLASAADKGDGVSMAKLVGIYREQRPDKKLEETYYNRLLATTSPDETHGLTSAAYLYCSQKDISFSPTCEHPVLRNKPMCKKCSEEGKQKSMSLYLKAVELGDAYAARSLGHMYEVDPKSDVFRAEKVRQWYERAAELGDTFAQFTVGAAYLYGTGATPKDAEKASVWLMKAAVKGWSSAQELLGLMYARGVGVPENFVLGYAWLNLAISSQTGPYEAKERHEAESLRNSLEKKMTPEQISEAQRLASNWEYGQTLTSSGRESATESKSGTLAKKMTGTVFVVSKWGHAVTNQHVVQGCKELRIEGREGTAKQVTEDAVNDLALVQITGEVKAVASIASEPGKLRQGEDIVVFGFPLNSLLSSGGNLTPGVVSALTGLGNNTNQIQITAPIQPGSSGSPVLNKRGEVVGVVSMKLSDSKMAKATGQIGQNVNFAVGGQTLKAFLDAHKVEYRSGGLLSFEKSTADLADEARKWTLVVECWK
jgi:TPR repeat protein